MGSISCYYILINNISDDIKAVYASYLIKMTPNMSITDRYFKLYFETDLYWKLLKDKARGTGQPNVNVPSLNALLFPLPPIEEQKEIVRILESVLDRENRVSELLSLMESISLLEKSILDKSFRGKI